MNDNDRRQLLLAIRSILSIASVLVVICLLVSRIYPFGNSLVWSILFIILAISVEGVNIVLQDTVDLMADGLMFLVIIIMIFTWFIRRWQNNFDFPPDLHNETSKGENDDAGGR